MSSLAAFAVTASVAWNRLLRAHMAACPAFTDTGAAQLLEQPSADLDIALSALTGHTFALLLREYLASPEYRASPLAQQPELQHASMGSIARIDANPEQSKNLETATVQLLGLSLDFVNLRKEVYEGESRIPSMVSVLEGCRGQSRRHDFPLECILTSSVLTLAADLRHSIRRR